MTTRIPVLASMLLSTLSMLVMAVFGLGALHWRPVMGVYPEATTPVRQVISWSAIHNGYLGWRATYSTLAAPSTVWRWYARHLAVEPEEGINSDSACIKLSGTQRPAGLYRVVAVTLCPARRGTRVSVNQLIQLRP